MAGLIMAASGLWAAVPNHAVSSEITSAPQATILLTGKLDPWRDRIDFGTVSLAINSVPAQLEPNGRYTARVPDADTYQLSASGPGIFTMVRTFGPEELPIPPLLRP